MGQCESCFRRCFGYSKRKYMRTHYKERNYSIEFENLMDDDDPQDDMQKPLTDSEKAMLSARQYDAIVHEQRKVDADLEKEIAKQEEEIRAEEEAFYEAKREASRIAKFQKDKEKASKSRIPVSKSWLGDNEDDWQVAGGDDDFEMFLANVKARSLASREKLGSGDGQSTSSSQTKEKSHDTSSVEMEWDHQADVTAPMISSPSNSKRVTSPKAKAYSGASDNLDTHSNSKKSEKVQLLKDDKLTRYTSSSNR